MSSCSIIFGGGVELPVGYLERASGALFSTPGMCAILNL